MLFFASTNLYIPAPVPHASTPASAAIPTAGSSGTMPTSKGYTGQRADAATGLDYYGVRYYDPVLGQFTSADDVLPGDGMDPWGSHGMRTSRVTPSRRMIRLGTIGLARR